MERLTSKTWIRLLEFLSSLICSPIISIFVEHHAYFRYNIASYYTKDEIR